MSSKESKSTQMSLNKPKCAQMCSNVPKLKGA